MPRVVSVLLAASWPALATAAWPPGEGDEVVGHVTRPGCSTGGVPSFALAFLPALLFLRRRR